MSHGKTGTRPAAGAARRHQTSNIGRAHQFGIRRTNSSRPAKTATSGNQSRRTKSTDAIRANPGRPATWARATKKDVSGARGLLSAFFLVFLGPIIFCIFAGVGWYVHKRKNADETYAAAARRVLCRRGTKVRAVAPAASEVSVVDAPAARIAPTELGTVVAVEQPPDELRHLSEE
jgi:hypothetical protein